MATRPVFFCSAATASASFKLSASGIFDLHMLASLEALKRLRGVHLRRRSQDDRIELRQFEGVGEIGRDMADPIFRRRLPGLVELAPDERDRLDPVDQLDRVEVSQAKGAGAGKRDFECLGHDAPWVSSSGPSSDLRL